jgi:hypothetical protein
VAGAAEMRTKRLGRSCGFCLIHFDATGVRRYQISVPDLSNKQTGVLGKMVRACVYDFLTTILTQAPVSLARSHPVAAEGAASAHQINRDQKTIEQEAIQARGEV